MSDFILSPEADGDLQDIFLFTRETWGESQAERYLRGLYDTFQLLADHPGIGRIRPELNAKIRSFPYQRHIIFIMQVEERTAIVRVVHGSRDIDGNVSKRGRLGDEQQAILRSVKLTFT